MKWFGVDSDTPNDPKIRALLVQFGRRSNKEARARMGGLFLVWCHIADHGAQPGRGISANGQPIKLQEIADSCYFDSVDELRDLLDFCATREHIDPEAWKQGIVFFPAMAKRADEYTKKVMRRAKSGQSPAPVRPVSGHIAGHAPESPIGTVDPVGVVPLPDHTDRSGHTQIARARALTGSGVMAGALPRDHIRHAFCGRVCVPEPLHGALIRQLGGDRDAAAETLRAWYARVLDGIPEDQPIGDEPFTFWRKHFAAAYPSAAPSAQAKPAARRGAMVADPDKYAGITLGRDDGDE